MSALNVNSSTERERFMSAGIILFFILAVGLLLTLFFPKNLLTAEVTQQKKPTLLTLYYLRNLLNIYPNNREYRLLLAQSQLKLGQYHKAELNLEKIHFSVKDPAHTKYLWLNYSLWRARTLAFSKDNPKRQPYEKKMVSLLGRLVHQSMTPHQQLGLIQDALFLQERKLAKALYRPLIKNSRLADAKIYGKMADVALALSDYNYAVKFYFLAQDKALLVNQKRHYFFKALSSYQQNSQLNEALAAVKQHIGILKNDQQTLAYLTQLSLAANKPKLAQMYIRKAIHLP